MALNHHLRRPLLESRNRESLRHQMIREEAMSINNSLGTHVSTEYNNPGEDLGQFSSELIDPKKTKVVTSHCRLSGASDLLRQGEINLPLLVQRYGGQER